MSLYKRGKVWHYEFQFKKKRYTKSTGETSKMRAREVEAKRHRELRDGNLGPVIEDISFKELSKKYLKNHAAGKRGEGFFKATVTVLDREFGETLLSDIGPAEVDAFMAARRAEVKPSTANRSMAVMKHLFKLGVRWGHLRENPAAHLTPEKERNGREYFLTEEQAGTLLEKCPGWLRPLVLAALHTGARRGELLGLNWEDVDLEKGLLTFQETKNGEPRTIRMSRTLREALKVLPSRFNAGPVFLNTKGRRMGKASPRGAFGRVVKKAKLPGFRFHDLRHTAASFMVQRGVTLNMVRVTLGHKDINMTLRYAHLATDHLQDVADAMDSLDLGTTPGIEKVPTKVTAEG